MKTRLHLCTAEDLDRLLPLMAACHAEEGIELEGDARRAAVQPLLEGSPHGAVYLIGPRQAPVGYAVLSFGWSVEQGGIDGRLVEFWIRPAVRGKGMGAEALFALVDALKGSALRALQIEVRRDSPAAESYARAGFVLREDRGLMIRRLPRA